MAHGLFEWCLKPVVGRLAIEYDRANTCAARGSGSYSSVCPSPVRIELIGIRRNENPGRGHHRRDEVDVVGGHREVHGASPDVSDDGCPSRSDLTLDVKVPVQDVGALRILLYVTIPDTIRRKTDVVVDAATQCCAVTGIRSTPACCGSPSGPVQAYDLERSSRGGIQAKLVRQRQHVKDPETASHGGLPILQGIPRKANSRFEVFRGGIAGDKTVDMNWPTRTVGARSDTRCGAIRKRGDFLDSVVGVFWQCRKFITQTHVHGEIRTRPPIVLDISGKKALPDGDLIAVSGSECIELFGHIR